MEHVTDWALLWRQIVEARLAGRPESDAPAATADPWAGRAREFDSMARSRPRGIGSRQEAVLDLIEPGESILDIGAGTGAWALVFATKAGSVTALDASPSMTAVLRENVTAAGAAGAAIRVIEGRWPEVEVERHDVTFAAHSMYGIADLPGFIRRMVAVTRRRCFLVVRLPTPGGLLAEAARHAWGHEFDSPNFVVGYNVLLQMGIAANVRVDPGSQLEPRTSATLEDALGRIKRHLGLGALTTHDAYLRALLERRLTRPANGDAGPLAWPVEGGGALIWWDTERPRA